MHKEPIFSHLIEVTSDDIDALGHASNIAYVRWVQDVAVAHSEAVGFGYPEYQELGAVFVIRRHEVDYLRPALRGDKLEVRTWVASAQAAKCVRMTEVRSASDGSLRAKASTTWGFVDVTKGGRPTRIPDAIRIAFLQPPRGRELARRTEGETASES
ncbi:MAG TPA: thioesterase family protein [Polyangiaceae bacterium]|nr:thioesterase family protein [Polyangiaceae bacterium]